MKKGQAVNEYGKLEDVLMCIPEYMQIKDPINTVQERYKHENIDRSKAIHQHKTLRQVLEGRGIRIHLLPPEKGMPEQVFTRDLGFSSDKGIIIGKMDESLRKPETDHVKTWLHENDWEFKEITTGTLEGGDILIDGPVIFAAESSRTTPPAIEQLAQRFPDKEIVSLPLEKKYLHLDCVFHVISPGTALLFEPALTKDALQKIGLHYRTIHINEKEQFQLAANVLPLGDYIIISQPENTEVNAKMREWGFEIIEVEFSEIIKSGGAFRCVTFPLKKSQ